VTRRENHARRPMALAVAVAILLASCVRPPSTMTPVHRATRAQKEKVAALVVSGPSGWTASRLLTVTTGRCQSSARPGDSGWLASAMQTWSQSPTPPADGFQTEPSLEVCLSLYATRADAADALRQVARQTAASEHPSVPPSSVPVAMSLSGMPGAVASFLDLSTVGQGSITFARGTVVASVDVVCTSHGGSSCAIGANAARREYRKLRY
jgi:hypothetical protein